MSEARHGDDELERLVHRHIELSELFEGRPAQGCREPPRLATLREAKDEVECLADLVDRALVAYEGWGFAQDPTIIALKFALSEAIVERSRTCRPASLTLGPASC